MKDYQKRVITERDELDEKCNKLAEFLDGENEATEEGRVTLYVQLAFMGSYLGILNERIEKF